MLGDRDLSQMFRGTSACDGAVGVWVVGGFTLRRGIVVSGDAMTIG